MTFEGKGWITRVAFYYPGIGMITASDGPHLDDDETFIFDLMCKEGSFDHRSLQEAWRISGRDLIVPYL
jgi:hypothetical protein